MKRLLLTILAIGALTVPAAAQYYYRPYPPPPPPPGYGYYPPPPPPYGYRPPPPRWRPAPRPRVGSICVTARGSCEYLQTFRLNTPCECYIPGFGSKRGAILR